MDVKTLEAIEECEAAIRRVAPQTRQPRLAPESEAAAAPAAGAQDGVFNIVPSGARELAAREPDAHLRAAYERRVRKEMGAAEIMERQSREDWDEALGAAIGS